jgi:hypothetical protein
MNTISVCIYPKSVDFSDFGSAHRGSNSLKSDDNLWKWFVTLQMILMK